MPAMTSKRPPRRDPRSEDSVTPPADDLSVRRSVANRPPLRENVLRAPGAESTGSELVARLAEAEAKRRRAEVFADSLAQKLVTLEAEVRGERESRARETPPAPVNVDAKESDALKEARAEWLKEREMLEAAAEIALRSERELLTKERAERADRESKTQMTLRLERERIARERTMREQAENERDAAEAAKRASEDARVDAEAARLPATSERDASRKALELSIAEVRQLRAALEAMKKERDQGAALLEALCEERDEARRMLSERSTGFDASGPRVNNAAMSAARAVISRLERHEQKLASLRTDALRRVLALLSEADAGANSRTGPLPTRQSDVSAGDRKTGTVPPPTSQLRASAKGEGSEIPPRPTQRAPEAIATPRPLKRTQQGLATLPRGAFVDPRTAPPPPEEEDIDAPPTRTIEIEVD